MNNLLLLDSVVKLHVGMLTTESARGRAY